jgi:ACR3 family arsenite transporter
VAATRKETATPQRAAALGVFERYLTVWVGICIVAGVALGQVFPAATKSIGALEVSRVNLPVGVLIWVMIIPISAPWLRSGSICAASA